MAKQDRTSGVRIAPPPAVEAEAAAIDPDVEREWIEEAEYRLQEMRSGKVRALSVEEVFGKYV